MNPWAVCMTAPAERAGIGGDYRRRSRVEAAARPRRFAALLESPDPMYESSYAWRAERGEKNLVSPDELTRWETTEWHEPDW